MYMYSFAYTAVHVIVIIIVRVFLSRVKLQSLVIPSMPMMSNRCMVLAAHVL